MVKAITYILNQNAAVRTLLGLNAEGDKYKVYPLVVPSSETHPYIAVRLTSKARQGKGLDCGFMYQVQVACLHKSYDEVEALNEAVIDALENYTAGTVNGMNVHYIHFVGEADDEFSKGHDLYTRITTYDCGGQPI